MQSSTVDNSGKILESNDTIDEEKQLGFQERLMLDREIYYQSSSY